MSEKHSQPWHWEMRKIDGDNWAVLCVPDGRQVIAVPVTIGGNVEDMGPIGRLIAAAPELIEALTAAIELVDGAVDYDAHPGAMARRAHWVGLIARIEGE